MPLTLEDIARMCGVSRSTVSRVINGERNVSPATRQRVLELVQQINFQPNLAARGLAVGRTRILGLVIPMGVGALFNDPFFPLLMQGVSSACNASGYSVMLWLGEPEYERRMVKQILFNGLLDGVIVANSLLEDPLVTAILESRLPYILVGRHPSQPRANTVDAENLRGARQAVEHLLRAGRQRIAAITGPLNMVAGWDRHQGYLDALRAAGMQPETGLVVEGAFSEASGYAAVARLLPHQPDAIFAASDGMALGALRALHDAGLRVPEDVALVGFDDIPAAALAAPPLTTVRQPIQRLGMAAADTLVDILAHPDTQPRQITLPTELVVRRSCGAV